MDTSYSFDAFDSFLRDGLHKGVPQGSTTISPIENSLESDDLMEVQEKASIDDTTKLRKQLFDISAPRTAINSSPLRHSSPFNSPPRSPSTDSGKGSDEESLYDEELEQPIMELVSNLIEVQGICHINLLQAHFVITHNEETNDFFLDLVPSHGSGESVLQVIFRFPENRNGIVEIFTSSYGQWARPGRVVYHDDSPPCTSADSYGSCCARYSAATNTVAKNATNMETISMEERENEVENDSNQVEEMNCDSSALTEKHCYCNDSRKNSLSVNDTNYGTANTATPKRQQHWHLQLHVYEDFYAIELNGRLIERYNHRFAFQKVQRID